ncbi:type VI secretion system protein [Acinetobacter baumannii]|uniref:type VI secretion system Vgr family protein n=1 Tax=Acinetobacter baumannii TaxID=470 RepID=UPI00070FBF1D|nr:type VI secretion system Vgr family protein [Acinetobacter baumannii]KQF19821.1 type VI secretion system protein [Acinetobacter baumannii]MDC4781108.1 type VI secretion system tip protein VgrG [Acinetobacter baumannii]MDC5425453.1 type VI secretion system tip protein VgrG [Acinetobacter baumannii]
MLNNIFDFLDKIGFASQKRALHIYFTNPEINNQVFLQRIDGFHSINEGLSAELICLSINPYISLKQFIGSQVAVEQVTDSGKLFRTTGIITGASQGQSDGALCLYKLTMQDATSLWHKRRNSRVFMNKSAVEIIEIIFKEWQNKSSLFAASLQLDSSGLTKNYDIRPFSMQSNESDYAYLTRLMREEGINWLIDESESMVLSNSQTIEPQKLRLIDHNNEYKVLERRAIRYHRSDATEQNDSITSFIAQRQLQPTAIHLQRWQADNLSQEDASGSVLSAHQHSSQRDNESLSLEQAWTIAPAWITDLNGEDQATTSSNSQIEKLNKQLNQYQALQAKYFIARSSVRDAQVGYWFKLNEHPELERNHESSDKEFLILSKRFYNQNNLPKDIRDQVEQLLSLSHWQVSHDRAQERQANELMVVRRYIDIVPEFDPLIHRPSAHVQRAKVVGLDGEEIHVDEWGRIKVRFLFTRTDDHQHDGGAGSNDNDTDSAWVDVLTPWAGEGYGARFLPRVGEIVVIDFFDGNIDRPFVTGRVHEGQRSPTKFDIKGQLPDTKKLSGIRTKEVSGSGFNQLRFDDTTGQISTQLHSSHGASQLNLGNLSYPKDSATSEGRGEGFELRTDQWGAVRAGDGLLISTYKQKNAAHDALNLEQTIADLKTHKEWNTVLEDNVKEHKVMALDALATLTKSIEALEAAGKETEVQTLKEAIIILTSPADITLNSSKNILLQSQSNTHISAKENINLMSDQNTVLASQKKLSLFSYEDLMQIISAKGKLEIQTHEKSIEMIANEVVKILSVKSNIELTSPEEITLTAKESQIKINGSGVFITTTGKFEVKAGQHVFLSGAKADLPKLTWSFKEKTASCMKNASESHEAFVGFEG